MEIYKVINGRSYRIEYTDDSISVYELLDGKKVRIFFAEGEDSEEYLEHYLENGYEGLIDLLTNMGLPEFD